MKIKNLISKSTALFFSAFAMISCVKDTDYTIPDIGELKKQTPAFDGSVVTFQQAKTTASATVTDYANNDAIEGYVVSSDEGGNFYKKIYIRADYRCTKL